MANEELTMLLKSVIQDELGPIKDQLQSVKMEILDTRAQINSRFNNVDSEFYLVKQDIAAIKSAVGRLEENEPEDVIGTLKYIKEKLDTQLALASKVSDHETDIKLIKKLLTNQ